MTAKKIIDMALKYVGVKESPANSNNVVFNTDYYGRAVSGSGYAWCCTFVWDIFRMTGASELFYDGGKTAYCPNVDSWGKNNKLTVSKDSGKYGDIVLFDFNKNGTADHIGLIISKNADGSYQTVEGNTAIGNDSNGGEVMIRTRNQSVIKTIIRPKYTEPTETGDSAKVEFIKGVQRATGAKVDGIAGSETLSKTITVSARINKRHAVVRVIQTYLNYLGYDCGKVDGIAGTKFTAAVKKYQAANGCVVDGEITARKKTWCKLLGIS
jgi:peptidoglycan hydrolase-like protein with peptidoglycan-binding domain